jgi:hypothetical protein
MSEQSVSGASDSSNNIDKTSSWTCVNDCSGNTLLVSSINTLTTSQNLSTNIPSKSKSKIRLSHQLNGSVPLTVHHQNVRGLRGKANELLSPNCCCNAKAIRDSSQVPWNKSLKIFHQNIRGMGNKANELYCHLHHDLPHILCLLEHYLSESELQLTHLTNYSLGASYCR